MEPLILNSKARSNQLCSLDCGMRKVEVRNVLNFWVYICIDSLISADCLIGRLKLRTLEQNVWHYTLKREPKAWLESGEWHNAGTSDFFDIYESWQKYKSCCFWSIFLFIMYLYLQSYQSWIWQHEAWGRTSLMSCTPGCISYMGGWHPPATLAHPLTSDYVQPGWKM